MLFRLTGAAPNVFSQSLKFALKRTAPSQKHFSTLSGATTYPLPEKVPQEHSLEYLSATNPHVNSYMKKLYQYLAASSVIGISSAHLLAFTVPLGFPSAFLILAGFGIHHLGTEYVEKTRPNTFVFKGADGKIQYGNSNSWVRKFGFLSSCLGYSCIIGSLLGMAPLAPSVLPLSVLTCLFSTLGHLGYCKFAPKPQFKPLQLVMSGLCTGILGLNFLMSGSAILMWENPLNIETLEVSTYLGLVLYNAFAGQDSKKIVGDIHNGKGDYLKHANKFAENWLYALIPHFMMSI